MMRKNGAPYQTFTRMTEKRAQLGSPSHGTASSPMRARIQLNALYEGSNSQNQASVLIAGGITHGTSSMPRHLRCPLAGRLCTKCATTKPISALKITALTANTTVCLITIQNSSRLNRNAKLPSPTKRSIDLLSVEVQRIERRVDHQRRDQHDQRQRHQEGDDRLVPREARHGRAY